MKAGEYILAKDHVEFIEKFEKFLFNRADLRRLKDEFYYYAVNYFLDISTLDKRDNLSVRLQHHLPFIWFVRCDGKERDGWKVYNISDKKICLQETQSSHDNLPLCPCEEAEYDVRIVIEIDDSAPDRKYVFKGIYKFCDKHGENIQYFDKVSDEI